MRTTDLAEVHALATRAFADPWTLDQFADELERPYGVNLVLRERDAIVAYAVAWRLAGEVEILHIAVDPHSQRRGFGRKLLDAVLASAPDAELACLDVRASNSAAIALYTNAGFLRTGLRRGYYASTGEDAVLMQCSLVQDSHVQGSLVLGSLVLGSNSPLEPRSHE